MGQSHSEERDPRSPEVLSHVLAQRFFRHSFTEIERYSFQDNFDSLASHQPPEPPYWTEDTLIRFLGLPDVTEAGPIVYNACTHIGAFPFPEKFAPCILTFEAMIKVIVMFTGRYKTVLKRNPNVLRLYFKSFAIFERDNARPTEEESQEEKSGRENYRTQENARSAKGQDEDDEDDLALAALEALDAIEVFKSREKPPVHGSYIPIENMIHLFMLLLLTSPLEPKQPIAIYSDRFNNEDGLSSLRCSAQCVTRGFRWGSKDGKGVLWRDFRKTIKQSMPYLFDGLVPLFEHFVFSKNFDMSPPGSFQETAAALQPLLPADREAKIMTPDILCQVALFVKGENLYRRMRLLYAGSEAGFSMGAFETRMLKWSAPTILLVSGERMPDRPESGPERAFVESLSSRRYPPGDPHQRTSTDNRVIFGLYLNAPWKLSHKECFGDTNTILFQLYPVHEVWRSSASSSDYAYFNKIDGLAFGNSLPKHSRTELSSAWTLHPGPRNLGPVSLTFDENFEFAVFQHMGEGGGAYHSSEFPYMRGDGNGNWQERFEIEEIEVWGLGGEKEAEEQRNAWKWEEREALARRGINLGKDIEADRALLEMAGIIGVNRSGGSMG